MSKNFEFMKSIHPKYYRLLDEIEQDARIRPKAAARNCRSLLEGFIDDLFTKNQIEKKTKLYMNLGMLKSLSASNSKLGIPRDVEVTYDVVDMHNRISSQKDRGFYFIKELANAASHESLPTEEGITYAVVSPAAVITALRVFHSFFTAYYKNRIKGGKPKFLDMLVPLGEYEISSCYTPVDSERSKCITEYLAVRRTGEFSKNVLYALVREYIPNNVDSLFLNRNLDVFSDAYSYTYSNGVIVKRLNKIDEPNTNFFIAYEFVRPVVPLAKFLKNNALPMAERIDICRKIAESLYQFHNADAPIYHRMLSFESIMISDFTDEGKGYAPYITKFDFAKITSITEGTVYDNLSEAEAKESLKLSRYRTDVISPDAPWDKVDIYSLGVLFVDIMMNNVSTREITEKTFEDLIDAGITDGMIDIIDEMLNEIPEERPSIGMVLEAINLESELHE